MTSVGGDPPLVTDPDVDALTWQFLNSDYVDDEYANWPLDRRLDGFLRNRGLGRLADNGDICNIILDRVMTYNSVVPRPHGQGSASATSSPSASPDPPRLRSIQRG